MRDAFNQFSLKAVRTAALVVINVFRNVYRNLKTLIICIQTITAPWPVWVSDRFSPSWMNNSFYCIYML